MAKTVTDEPVSSKIEKFTFKASDFRNLLNKQEYKCYVTQRELTPETTFAEHIVPLRQGGKHTLSNICLVHEILYRLKRYHSIAEIIEMSADVIKTHGKKHGYQIKKSK
ncbi:HNH endonuclease [Leptospira kanakyensis]|uniref:HNH endonuclease n=1 Tax=Leptospira kanakyensis TaxID=2484968 RepID=UPI00223D57A8|nr:hypothetical protein [Leptospira kanakyensis]MCW7470575.1 hypothetical protein [Leptospira kanakyensis]